MAHGLNNDLYKRHQSNERGLAATFVGLEERHTDGNGAHNKKRKLGNSNGFLKGVIFYEDNKQRIYHN